MKIKKQVIFDGYESGVGDITQSWGLIGTAGIL